MSAAVVVVAENLGHSYEVIPTVGIRWKLMGGSRKVPQHLYSHVFHVQNRLPNWTQSHGLLAWLWPGEHPGLARLACWPEARLEQHYWDPLVLSALQALDEGASLFPRARREDWLYLEEKLYFKGCLYIPEGAHRDIVVSIHESAAGGHGGIFRTQDLVARDFWWPGLNAFIRRFILGCAICQANKVNTHPSAPHLTPLASVDTHPFQQVSVNLVTDLPSSLGFDSVMVVVDHGLTKGVIISPCHKNIDAAGVAQLFFKNVFTRFGLHDRCISDRGTQFASAFARELA
jgi:hypothetical protein